MTAAGPDPYAETVRLLPADTFTQQTRAVLYEIAARTLFEIDGGTWPDDCTFPEDYRKDSEAVVDALLAYLAAQRPRPMPGAHNG